jgi:hypothetical protein
MGADRRHQVAEHADREELLDLGVTAGGGEARVP